MTNTHRPAELEDLDRYEGQVVEQAHFERMAQRFDALVYDRIDAEDRARHAVAEARRHSVEQRATRLATVWFLACALFAGIAYYLNAIGQ